MLPSVSQSAPRGIRMCLSCAAPQPAPAMSGRWRTGACAAAHALQAGRQSVRQRRRAAGQLARAAAGVAAEQLPANLRQLVGAFKMVPDARERYKQLLFYAKKLPPMPAEEHVDANKVWVVAEMHDDKKLYWRADSDSELTKGLAALLVKGLSGCAPEEIVGVEASSVIEALGLSASLTPSRNNGFLNMFRLMQKKALGFLTQADVTAGADSGMASPDAPTAAAASSNGSGAGSSLSQGSATAQADGAAADSPNRQQSNSAASTSGAAAAAAITTPPAGSSTPVQDSIRRKLTEALAPVRLEVHDDSAQHAGHAGSRMQAGYSGETHFRVDVASSAFQGLKTLKQHRLVYDLLKEELAGSVHALSLTTSSPHEI